MKRLILTSVAALVIALPAVASAKAPTARHTAVYEHAYRQVAAKFGARAPGRNIVKDGLANGRALSDALLVASTHTLERMLIPPAPVYVAPRPAYTPAAAATAYAPAPAPSYSSGSSLPSCTWAPESGGNYSAVNSSSGAYGKYQIMPSTAAAYGCSLSTPSGQDACAQTIWRKQGPSAWVNC